MSEQIEGDAVSPADIIVLSEAMGIQSLIAARTSALPQLPSIVRRAMTHLVCNLLFEKFDRGDCCMNERSRCREKRLSLISRRPSDVKVPIAHLSDDSE
ncbi:hypothetical protein ABIF50_009761 [Bradyrhizobium diazoefficiens]